MTSDIQMWRQSKAIYPLKVSFRYTRRILKALFGKDHLIGCDVAIPRIRLGNDWGDWTVAERLLGSDSIVYSVGLGKEISFDRALIARFGCQVFGFDPTPISQGYLAHQELPRGFTVLPFGLATEDGKKDFGAPTAAVPSFSTHLAGKDSVRLDVLKLSSIMSKLGHSHIDVLKMDIEGEEFPVIEQILHEGILPTQILVEFHHGWYGLSVDRTRNHLKLLKSAGYRIFAVSAIGREFSFIHQSAMEAATTVQARRQQRRARVPVDHG
jgi:FkbM family methyltransferase